MKYLIPKGTLCLVVFSSNPSIKTVGFTQRDILLDLSDIVLNNDDEIGWDEIGWNDIDNEVSYWILEKDAKKLP